MPHTSTHPRIKSFRQEGCLSTILFDDQSTTLAGTAQREGIIIDPTVELLESYREYLLDEKIHLNWIIDTHVHADHHSGTHALRQEFKADIAMGAQTKSQRVTKKLQEGDLLSFGRFQAEVLMTPGHTPDAISLKVGQLLFTGDLLLIGNTGRTDFPGSDPKQSYDSLQKILKLDPATIFFPGHDYRQLLFSTLKNEKENNPDLKLSEQDFIALKKSEVLMSAAVSELNEVIQYNLSATPQRIPASSCATQCGTVSKDLPNFASITVDKLAPKMAAGDPSNIFVDVREPDEFQEGHMPGSRLIPMAELGFHLDELKNYSRIYLSCRSGARSGICTRTLDQLGFRDVVNVTGGFKAWESAGLPIKKSQ